MKYQSELIKEIVDTRGHKESSLHYESECMETWIEEAKGGYPKLCDYESEWLKYISILDDTGGSEDPEPPIGEFPYVVLSDVTEATIDNVVPYAYKSAILKGHTLVNLTKNSNVHFKSTITDTWQNVPTTFVENRCCLGVKNIEPNTKYIMKILSSTTQLYVRYFNSGNDICNGNSGWINSNTAFTTKSDTSRIYITLRISENNEEYSNISECANIILLKYQDGMENWDIPYFEGMQSVKMPVLTTTGKNLFPTNNIIEYGTDNKIVGQSVFEVYLKSGDYCSSYFHVDDSDENTMLRYELLDEQNNQVLGKGAVDRVFTIENDGLYKLKFSRGSMYNGMITKIRVQIEEGSTATPYEPHKTNILTANEDVTLRGIGKVQDELNLLTGELTQRIGEIVLDGSHNIVIGFDNNESYETMEFFIEGVYKNGVLNHKQISDKLPYNFRNDDYEHFYVSNKRVIMFVKKSKLATQDTNGFKQYLSQNPITIQYQLETESIKTVDLNIQDQNGKTLSVIKPIEGKMFLSTSSDTIKPLFSGEIPVEAITQNLASFIDLETEE